MSVFLNILIMIVILGVLVSIHEAGHLAMAKIFHVYCFDYSIGFGPAFLHKKRKNGETYFSLRAFPLGGYVSMYGEPGVVPEGVEPPPANRSIEGIAKWKKAIVLIAGVTLNYLLGLLVIFLSYSCFTQYFYGYGLPLTETETGTSYNVSAYAPATYTGAFDTALTTAKGTQPYKNSNYLLYEGCSNFPTLTSQSSVGTIIDSNVIVYNKDKTPYQLDGKTVTWVAVYAPSTLTAKHTFVNDLYLYPATSEDPSKVSSLYAEMGVTHFPDTTTNSDGSSKAFKTSLLSDGEVYFDLDTTVFPVVRDATDNTKADLKASWASKITVTTQITAENKGWSDNGVTMEVVSERDTWNEAWQEWAAYVPYANKAIIQGIGSLFTINGWKNASGIVGMTAAVGTVSKMGGAGSIFLFAGVISINLAFFNLLPFPGLDGWGLLVTAIEGIVNSIKRAKFKKEHPGQKLVDILIPYDEEEDKKKKAEKEAAKEAAEKGLPVPTSEPEKKPLPEVPLKEGEVAYYSWRIPSKIKGWVSMVGLGLLFLMAILITVKDIISL
jgi:membrane-associated protease RseP (regulator of RpoE activity)